MSEMLPAILVVAVVVGLLIIGARALAGGDGEHVASTEQGYRKRASVLPSAERSLYFALVQASAGQFTVMARLQLSDLLEPVGNKESRPALDAAIQSHQVPFTLCRPDTLEAVLAVEIGTGPAVEAAAGTPAAVAGLPVVYVPARQKYSAGELRDAIRAALAS